MPTLRQLRDRVRSLKNTQQITRAMKMVAGARIRRAELAMKAARPYAAAIGDMLQELASVGGATHALLQPREVRANGYLLLTADKGMCGAFNSNLVRAALGLARQAERPRFYLVGLKGRVQLRHTPFGVQADWALQSKPFPELASDIAARLSQDFLLGTVDNVTMISSRFVSTIVQRPTMTQLLPIVAPHVGGSGSTAPESLKAAPGSLPSARESLKSAPESKTLKNAFEFEPDAGAVLAALLPKYLEFTIFQALLETQASEFAARLIAMTNATDNAGKLIDDLTLVMNKTRQASITKEILEIVGGAEALRG